MASASKNLKFVTLNDDDSENDPVRKWSELTPDKAPHHANFILKVYHKQNNVDKDAQANLSGVLVSVKAFVRVGVRHASIHFIGGFS